jgi:short-subunit dehydrogenase
MSRQVFDGKVAVVTGASGGVGRATVRRLAERYRGIGIGLIARGQNGLEGAAREVEERGGRPLVIPADVSDAEAVEAAAERAEGELGEIGLWVNDAMVSMYSPFMKMTAKEFQHIINVTLMGFVHGTQSALRRMIARNRGVIVQVGSALAFRSIPLQSAYCAAKHGMKGFTESVRSELMHDGIDVRVSMVHLPGVNTTQFSWTKNRLAHKPRPTGTIHQPEVAAEAVVWLAGHPRRQILLAYPTVEAVTGEKFIPGELDKYLSHKAWEGAQLDEPAEAGHADNFWKPLPGDHGAHGPFDGEAWKSSPMFWVTRNKGALMTLAAGAGVAAAAYLLSGKGNGRM